MSAVKSFHGGNLTLIKFFDAEFLPKGKKKVETAIKSRDTEVLERYCDDSQSSLNLAAVFPLLYRATACLPSFFSNSQTIACEGVIMSHPISPSQRCFMLSESPLALLSSYPRHKLLFCQQTGDHNLNAVTFVLLERSSQGDSSKLSFAKKSMVSFFVLKISGGFNWWPPEYRATFPWWNHERK